MDEHRRADAAAANAGVSAAELMEAAGQAVAEELAARRPEGAIVALCGPGDNGGDGFVAARALREAGRDVTIMEIASASRSPAAAAARAALDGEIAELDPDRAAAAPIVIDALFGAGLSRPLEGAAAACANAVASRTVVAVDVPSGVLGDSGGIDGDAFRADLTVTFIRPKPAHYLDPGRERCGEIVVRDIGHPDACWEAIDPKTFENAPALWAPSLRWPDRTTHKHARGRLSVVTGDAANTGAARLAAVAGLRAGAGLVTLLTPPDALVVAATASTAVMTRAFTSPKHLAERVKEQHAVVIGPAAGVGEATRAHVLALLASPAACVLDADALTSFEREPDALLTRLRPGDVITPHPGEFARLFPDLADRDALSAARAAADRAGCVVLLKGATTVVAEPDGRVALNVHASPFLATAGAGDVLAGIVGGWRAQGVPAFDAAAASVWMHGDASLALGPGLIADDLVAALPKTLRGLYDART